MTNLWSSKWNPRIVSSSHHDTQRRLHCQTTPGHSYCIMLISWLLSRKHITFLLCNILLLRNIQAPRAEGGPACQLTIITTWCWCQLKQKSYHALKPEQSRESLYFRNSHCIASASYTMSILAASRTAGVFYYWEKAATIIKRSKNGHISWQK